MIIEFTPITFPSKSNNGPPELPLFIDASVCMKSSYLPPSILPLAETIPAVTVPPSPCGLPIAITQLPTFAVSESPNSKNGRLFASTFKSAKSVSASEAINSASNFNPSVKVTCMSEAFSTT